MHSLYNRVAGQNVERLAALSDGFVAVAKTLIVIGILARQCGAGTLAREI